MFPWLIFFIGPAYAHESVTLEYYHFIREGARGQLKNNGDVAGTKIQWIQSTNRFVDVFLVQT
jgi:hypothetical protein